MDFKYKIGEIINGNIIIGIKVKKDNKGKKRKNYYIKCLQCGDEKKYREDSLKKLSNTSCRICRTDWKYQIGEIVNNLKITDRYLKEKNKNKEKRYKYKCLKDGYEGDISQASLTNGIGCPICAGRYIYKGVNDMWTTAPEMAKYLFNKEDGYIYGKGSPQKVCFICPYCEEKTKPIKISDVYFHKKISCDQCRDTSSTGEKIIYNLLKYLGVNFEAQQTFEWSNKKRYDFYLSDYNMIIEFNGLQHYKEIDKFKESLAEIQENDKYKERIAKNNGIKNYIIIEGKNNYPIYIKNSIKQSDLKNFFDLESVDWEEIIRKSMKNRITKIIDLWNQGERDIKLISNEIGLKKETIGRYLMQFTYNKILNYPYIPKNYPILKQKQIKEIYNIK